jgi:hypothetical protein
LLLVVATAVQAEIFFQQTNLVSSVSGLAAFTDPNLKNPWGISHSTDLAVLGVEQVHGKRDASTTAPVSRSL